MNPSDGFDRTVSAWLRADAEHRVPDHLDAVLRRTRTERQRPAWSSLERWLPMQATPSFTPVPRVAWLLIVTALTVLLGAAILFVAAQPRVPPPFGIARNGPIVHDAADGDIHVFDPVTGTSRVLIGGPEHDVAPYFSHNGTKFLFARETGPAKNAVMVANADGTGVRALTEPIFLLTWAAWSPDDRRLAIVSDAGSKPTLRIVSIDGATDDTLDLAIAGGVTPVGTFSDVWVQWRPNGRELVFKGMTVGPVSTTYGLYVVGVDGSGLRPILASSSEHDSWQAPALSPDGTKVAWGLWDGDGIGRIRVVDVDTGKVRVPFFEGLSTGDWGPAWSPDGQKLVFNRLVSGGQEGLVVAPAGGGPVVEVGPRFPAYSGGARGEFSPDGTTVIATYNQEAVAGEVHLLDAAGGSDRSLSIVTDLGAIMQRLAP